MKKWKFKINDVGGKQQNHFFGDVPDLNIDKALKIAKNRIEWKNLRPSKRC